MKNKKVILTVTSIVFVLVAGIGVYFAVDNESMSSDCITIPSGSQQCREDYLGLTQQQAVDKAFDSNLAPKIIRINNGGQDNEENIINTDLGGLVIYFEIENDQVTKVIFEDEFNVQQR